MLSFIGIIKHNGIIASYRIQQNHQNQYHAELINRCPATGYLPQQVSLNQYKLAQSAADRSDLVVSRIASAILHAENNQEDFF